MLSKNKIVLATGLLALFGAMNAAQAAPATNWCDTATNIKAAATPSAADIAAGITVPTTTDIGVCGAIVQAVADAERTAALAILVSKVPSLSTAAANSLATGGNQATVASSAFETLLSSSTASEAIKKSVAAAAAQVLADNPITVTDDTNAKSKNTIIEKLLIKIVAADPTVIGKTTPTTGSQGGIIAAGTKTGATPAEIAAATAAAVAAGTTLAIAAASTTALATITTTKEFTDNVNTEKGLLQGGELALIKRTLITKNFNMDTAAPTGAINLPAFYAGLLTPDTVRHPLAGFASETQTTGQPYCTKQLVAGIFPITTCKPKKYPVTK